MNKFENHTFVICAYKESEFLPQCIESVLYQSVKSNVIITTSTANNFIKRQAEKYGLPLFINSKQEGIGADWNFAIGNAATDYVTIAHQDDIYTNKFVEHLQQALEQNPLPLIAFTSYRELKNNRPAKLSRLLKCKKLALAPLMLFPHSKIIRKTILSFGTPICCPSVTLNKKLLGSFCFDLSLKSNLDWHSWLKISKMDGSFLYIPHDLVFHRIHPNSETNFLLCSNERKKEDFAMLSEIWPKPIASLISYMYMHFFGAYDIAYE